jgi:DNA-binding winged helix-turn-helix (wHTH) protein
VVVVDGLLVHGGRRLVVPPSEAVILDRLGETPDRVVSRDELAALVGGGAPVNPSSLGTRVARLRDRLRPVGLVIHTVRGRGFLLTTAPGPGGGS